MKKNVIILLIFFPFFLFSQEVCSDYDACNYAYEGDCQYPALYYDCNNNCINDIDNDNICDELEILGCTDNSSLDGNPMACNFDPLATENDGSCLYPGLIFDCDGTLAPVHMQVTPAVRDSVTKLSRLVPVAVISSRDFHDISWLAKDLGLTAPQISEGGARLFDAQTARCLDLQCLEIPDAEDIFKLLDKQSLEFIAVDEDKRISAVNQIISWN